MSGIISISGIKSERKKEIQRKTRETDISAYLNIDGSGISSINIDDGFLRHMLETLSKYSDFDIEIACKGEDRHHVIEDIGITLGKAFRESIGNDPTARIGHAIVPMDDALVMVSVDILDRPYIDLTLPDKSYVHFLRSFAMEAKISLHNLVLKGHDEHHIIEATFKGLGLALKNATARTDRLLSTKDNVIIR